jgi:hypothetical protein
VIKDPDVRLAAGWVPPAEWVEGNRAAEDDRGADAGRWAIEATLARGYGVATLYHGDFAPDASDVVGGVRPLFLAPGQDAAGEHDWGAVATWAWGLSRALDYLQADPDVDGQRVLVVGHSRNGKAALLAGAFDPRFAAVVAHQSGCTGAALSRRPVGETVLLVNTFFPHWFPAVYRAFNNREAHLPVDQHLLVAMVAPRPILVVSGLDDTWADPEGELLGAALASPVYSLLGQTGLPETWPTPLGLTVGGPLAYHLKPGGHGIGPAEWAVVCDFADEWL